jgi:hypothetical protein
MSPSPDAVGSSARLQSSEITHVKFRGLLLNHRCDLSQKFYVHRAFLNLSRHRKLAAVGSGNS